MTHIPRTRRQARWLLGLSLTVLTHTFAMAQAGGGACGDLANGYGPYDSRTDQDKLPIVLDAHFTQAVESLSRGNTSHKPGPDIDYTLRAIPNHPRALIAMMRLGVKEKTQQPSGSKYTVECWFDRAIRFRPKDRIVRIIYSTYLKDNGRVADAIKQLEVATILAEDSAFTHYNIGLHYFDLKNYDKALAQAHKAMALGFPQAVLQEQLHRVGKWVDPTTTTTSAAATAAASQETPANAPETPQNDVNASGN